MIRSGSCLNFCHPLPGPTHSAGRFSFSGVNSVNPVLESDKYRFVRLSCNTFRFVCVVLVTSIYISVELWMFSSFGTWRLNPRFDVMTTNVIPFDQPKIVTGCSVVHYFVFWLRLVQTSLKASTELFASYRSIPPWSGFSESMASSRQLRRQFESSIIDWEYEVVHQVAALSLCIWVFEDFWHVQIFQLLNVCDQNISFPHSLRDWSIAEEPSR